MNVVSKLRAYLPFYYEFEEYYNKIDEFNHKPNGIFIPKKSNNKRNNRRKKK